MRLLACLAAAVCGNLVATLYHQELPSFSDRLMNQANTGQLLYYALDSAVGKEPNKDNTCKALKELQSSMVNLNDVFYAIGTRITETGRKCTGLATIDIETLPEAKASIEKPQNMKDVYQSILVRQALQINYDPLAEIEKIIELVKADDSVVAGALAIQSAVIMWRQDNELDLEKLLSVIDVDDLYAQADTIDNQISFNNDIGVTYFFVQAAFELSEYKGAPLLSNDKLIGFGNFVAAGFRPTTPQEIYYYIKLTQLLANGKYGGVVRVSLINNRPLYPGNGDIALQTVDLAGHPRRVKLIARSITRVEDNEVVITDAEFKHPETGEQRFPDNPTEETGDIDWAFVYNFIKSEPKAGYYDLELEVSGEKIILTDDAIRVRVKSELFETKLKVVREVYVDTIRTAIGSKKLGSKLTYKTGSFDEDSTADTNSKVSVQFVVNGKSGENHETAINAHQAFVTAYNTENGQSTTFIAEPNEDNTYFATFDVKEHLEYNGEYFMELSVGDVLFHPGMAIHQLGTIKVSGLKDAPIKGAWSSKYTQKFEAKPEKSHTFREPEPRPPVIISLVFTGLCAVPLLGLLIAWKTLGINVNKMESSYLPFHVAIASVFGLYFLYWYKLNMFTTLKYLALLGSVTFILGNKVLSALATPEK